MPTLKWLVKEEKEENMHEPTLTDPPMHAMAVAPAPRAYTPTFNMF